MVLIFKSNKKTMKDRYPEFDVLRSIAIIMIYIQHLANYSFAGCDLSILGIRIDLSLSNDIFGHLGLGIFFFSSAYLIYKSTRSLDNISEIRDFIIRRCIRIIPLYYLSLFIFIHYLSDITGQVTKYCIAVHLLCLQGLLASSTCIPIATLWFVGVIVLFYILFIAINRFGFNFRRLVCIAACFALFCIVLKTTTGLCDKRLLLYLPSFMFGIIVARYGILGEFHKLHNVSCAAIFAVAIYVYIFVLSKGLLEGRSSFLSPVNVLIFTLLNVIMITGIIITYNVSRLNHASAIDGLGKLAYSSYCVYLFHRPVWWITLQVVKPSSHAGLALLLGIVGLPLTIAIAYFVQKLYDVSLLPILKKILIPSRIDAQVSNEKASR